VVQLETVIFVSLTLLHHVDNFSNGALPVLRTHLLGDK
jgi:hypothetical protein